MRNSLTIQGECTLIYSVFILTYLAFGYTLGKLSNKEYYDKTPTEQLGIWRKICRRLFFPHSYSDWTGREFRMMLRDMVGSEKLHCEAWRKGAYCMVVALGSPIYLLIFPVGYSIVLVLCGFIGNCVKRILIGIFEKKMHIPELRNFLNTNFSMIRFRDKLKYLLLGTWGQSVLGAPAWMWFIGWKLAALNIGLSWIIWKFGKQQLIQAEKSKPDLRSLSEAIKNLQRFRTKELDRPLIDVHKLLEDLYEVITRSKLEQENTKSTRDRLLQIDHPLAGSFALTFQQLDDLIQGKQAEYDQLSQIAKGLEAGKKDLELHEKLLKTNQFIEDKRPGSTNVTQVMRDAQASIDALQEMIRRASQTHARSLAAETPDSAFSPLPIEDIASEVLRGMDHAEQIGRRGTDLRLQETRSHENTVAPQRALA